MGKIFRPIFRRCLLGLMVLLIGRGMLAQEVAAQEMVLPKGEVLALEDLYDHLQQFHPGIGQIDLLGTRAEMRVMGARGAFDPKLKSEYSDKYFADKNYWRKWDAGLEVPTRFGLKFKAGYYYQDGLFVNPETVIPQDGQVFGGVEMPIGQGLLIDPERAELRQQQLGVFLTEAEQRLRRNDLLLLATEAYWQWAATYGWVLVYERALQQAQTRKDAIVAAFEAGDLPGIDTVEASVQLQQWQLERQEALLAYQNAQVELLNYYWGDTYWLDPGNIAMLPDYDALVDLPVSVMDTVGLFSNRIQGHPALRKQSFKIAQLEVEQKLAREMLKPTLNLSYQLLSGQATGGNNGNTYDLWAFTPENYKWGLTFSLPLYLRKARGKVAETRLKLQDAQMELEQKRQAVSGKIQASANKVAFYHRQAWLAQGQVDNYRRLLEAENLKFRAGESTLFLINSREVKLIEAEKKWISALLKWQMSRFELAWALGTLGDVVQ